MIANAVSFYNISACVISCQAPCTRFTFSWLVSQGRDVVCAIEFMTDLKTRLTHRVQLS